MAKKDAPAAAAGGENQNSELTAAFEQLADAMDRRGIFCVEFLCFDILGEHSLLGRKCRDIAEARANAAWFFYANAC